jgi:hypothetical protein
MHKILEGYEGVQPSSTAWKAVILGAIRITHGGNNWIRTSGAFTHVALAKQSHKPLGHISLL